MLCPFVSVYFAAVSIKHEVTSDKSPSRNNAATEETTIMMIIIIIGARAGSTKTERGKKSSKESQRRCQRQPTTGITPTHKLHFRKIIKPSFELLCVLNYGDFLYRSRSKCCDSDHNAQRYYIGPSTYHFARICLVPLSHSLCVCDYFVAYQKQLLRRKCM